MGLATFVHSELGLKHVHYILQQAMPWRTAAWVLLLVYRLARPACFYLFGARALRSMHGD